MKFADALDIINKNRLDVGYMVSFERKIGSLLFGDHFPDKRSGETLIETEAEAWEYARRFAASTKGECVNIYVIRGDNFVPVKGYEAKMIINR